MAVRILVIDDDDDDVELIDRVLMERGFTSLLASSGEDAIRIAAIQQPDLVLLDIHMPRLDGYEVAATIRRQPGLAQAKIVAVTGATDQGERIAAAGFDGYITKPIDLESFVGQIEAFLAARPA